MRESNIYLSIILLGIILLGFLYNLATIIYPNSHGLNFIFQKNFSFHESYRFIINNIHSHSGILLLEIFIILTVSRVFGFFFAKLGVQAVVGEIVAGLVLGPSLLGYFFPEVKEFLFPDPSIDFLKLLSQIGLILFLFIMGLEISWEKLRDKLKSAVVISHFTILVSFISGIILSFYLYNPKEEVSFLTFSLFIGIAMSITAFPILAKIIQERNLTKDRGGILAISCAAFDDITAWILLAIIISISQASSLVGIFFVLVLLVLYLLFTFKVIRKKFKAIIKKVEHLNFIPKNVLLLILLWLTISSFFTEAIGIHLLFGAFIAGMSIPAGLQFRTKLLEKIEDIATVYFLPLFFVYSGLKTNLILLFSSYEMVFAAIAVILVAVLGKLVAGIIISRTLGESWKDSFIIGILINTRGLMELVVLNIGLEQGFITNEIFTIMVLMAIVTTLMTGPLLNLIDYLTKKTDEKQYAQTILIPFARPESGIQLTKLAFKLFPSSDIICFHVSQNYGIDIEKSDLEMGKLYENIRFISENEGIPVSFHHIRSEDFNDSLASKIQTIQPNLVLLGSAKKNFSKEILEGIPKCLFESKQTHFAVYSGESTDLIRNFYIDKENKKLIQFLELMGADLQLLKYTNRKTHFDKLQDLYLITSDQNIAINGNYLIFNVRKV